MDAAVLLDGVVRGLQLGLLAVGLTLLYGLGGILNLAHGALAVSAALVAANASDGLGLPIVAAAAIGIAFATGVALLLDRTVMQAAYRLRGGERVLLSLLLSLGAALVIEGLFEWRYPSGALSIRVGGGPVDLFGIPMRRGSLVAAATAVVVIALVTWFLRATTTGRAVRSVIQDEVGARLVGIDPARMRTIVFALAGALAGLVAMTSAMSAPVDVRAGFGLTILALIVTVVGGLGSAAGALLAGVLLGVVEAVSAAAIGASYTSIILLAAAGLTILVRPSGLLGGSG